MDSGVVALSKIHWCILHIAYCILHIAHWMLHVASCKCNIFLMNYWLCCQKIQWLCCHLYSWTKIQWLCCHSSISIQTLYFSPGIMSGNMDTHWKILMSLLAYLSMLPLKLSLLPSNSSMLPKNVCVRVNSSKIRAYSPHNIGNYKIERFREFSTMGAGDTF